MEMILSLVLIGIAGLVVCQWRWSWPVFRRNSKRFRHGYVCYHPSWRDWLRERRLVEAEDFLELDAMIVSGHPGRQVGQLTFPDDNGSKVLFLKREMQVRWTTRWSHFLTGWGWVSRCVREARVLEALERDGLAAPRWLATGEDERGRAFLLVEEVPEAISLSQFLASNPGFIERRKVARVLGATLARLHDAGFFHRDLYAKHVLLQEDGQKVVLLDWQRAWRGAWVQQNRRIHDLATLHATLADNLASPRERLALLLAYFQTTEKTEYRPLRRLMLRRIQAESLRLRGRRHIREKRQPPVAAQQAWIRLDQDEVYVTPEWAALTGNRDLNWLPLAQNQPAVGPISRRWFQVDGSRQLLLERRRDRITLNEYFRHWVLGRPMISPDQRRATLLWRLQKHGVASPKVLAAGRSTQGGNRVWHDSFLLCEPLPGTIRLGAWLERVSPQRRRKTLSHLGQMLGRMHEACCYLNHQGVNHLAVRAEDHDPQLVLDGIDGVRAMRHPSRSRARRDLRQVKAFLIQKGCDGQDLALLRQGYAETEAVDTPMSANVPDHRDSSGGDSGHVPVPSLWHRLTRGWRRLQQRPDWADYVGSGWPDRIMNLPVTDRFHEKQGRSTGRLKLTSPDGGQHLVVYLKRHYILPWWDGLLAIFWPRGNWSPAMMEFEHLEWARQQGVPVPATVAAGEILEPWGKLRSFLAVEELTDMLPLNEAIPLAEQRLSPDDFRLWKRGLVAEMARLARLLHDRRHYHKDLYLCHYYIHVTDLDHLPGKDPASWRGRIFLIDLHRLTHHPWTWWLWQLKDLAQLLY
ncbi:MAG: lipopolysaccharide kinase InaA family protein, partial [Gemmataceae bacterium]